MAEVTVFHFVLYDIGTEDFVTSQRMATAEAIARLGGIITEKARQEALAIDESDLLPGYGGMTFVDFATLRLERQRELERDKRERSERQALPPSPASPTTRRADTPRLFVDGRESPPQPKWV